MGRTRGPLVVRGPQFEKRCSGGLGHTTRFKNEGTWLSVRFPHMWCIDNGLNARGHLNAVKYDSLLSFSGLPICELHAKAQVKELQNCTAVTYI